MGPDHSLQLLLRATYFSITTATSMDIIKIFVYTNAVVMDASLVLIESVKIQFEVTIV